MSLLVFFDHPVAIYISLLGTARLWLLGVGLPVEVGEEEEEHGAVEEDDVAEDLWEVALYEEGQGGVHKEGHKLTQLHGREVPATRCNCDLDFLRGLNFGDEMFKSSLIMKRYVAIRL